MTTNSPLPGRLPAFDADDVDLALIDCLSRDGRMSATDIAREVGLSSDSVRDRLKRLLDAGVVKVVGSVDPATVGLSVLAMVGVTTSGPIESVGRQLAHAPGLDFVACAAGRYDLLVELVGATPAEALSIIDEQVRSLPQVTTTETLLYESLEKWTSREKAAAVSTTGLDPEELALVEELRGDGRITYRELAARTGINYPTARRKAISLLDRGVVRIITSVNRLAIGGQAQAAVGVKVSGELPQVVADLRRLAEIDVIAATAGRFDLLLDVVTPTDGMQAFVHEHIRSVPGVVDTETFTYLKVLKMPFGWSIPQEND